MKVKSMAIFLFALLACMIFSTAHSGRTDANGGHYDSSTGQYHYHTGEYAGQTQSPSEPEPEVEIVEKTVYETVYKINWPLVIIISMAISILLWILTCIHYRRKVDIETNEIRKSANIEIRKERTEKESATERSKENLAQIKAQCKKDMAYVFGCTSIEVLSNIPSGTTIGPDGLPQDKQAKEPWGHTYTYYIAEHGTRYHRSQTCMGRNLKKINFYTIPGHYIPCQQCKTTPPNEDWYEDYQILKKIANQYGLPIEPPKKTHKNLPAPGQQLSLLDDEPT